MSARTWADRSLAAKAISGVGFVEDHQSPLEYLHNSNTGIGAFKVEAWVGKQGFEWVLFVS
jgi:hypothetical protein